jgi:hypothetical protein
VSDQAREGFLTFLLEPASQYSDLYSVASVCDLRSGQIDIEVVGPGFDASDILRSDVIPHERFEIFAGTESNSLDEHSDHQITRTFSVDKEAYRESTQRRLAKIGARLRNASFPEKELRIAEVPSDRERLVQHAVEYLRRSGKTLLLDHLQEYDPIPLGLLKTFVTQVMRLLQAAKSVRVNWQQLSLAGSFLDTQRLVLWDFFPPGNDETRVLSSMKA